MQDAVEEEGLAVGGEMGSAAIGDIGRAHSRADTGVIDLEGTGVTT